MKDAVVKSVLRRVIEGYYGPDFDVLTPPDPKLGDYSTNLPFVLGKKEKKNPAEKAREILEKLAEDKELKRYFSRIEFAPPGFINFYFSEDYLRSILISVLDEKENYGSAEDKKIKINLEFVSANPTGPVTVHNVRAAPYGDTLANVLRKAGYGVIKEYYINDAGNQVRILGESVARRYLRIKGKEIDFPENMYQGEYVTDIAREIEREKTADKIENFDELVSLCREYSVNKLVASIKTSLNNLGVGFDTWFSEKTLHDEGAVADALALLEKGGHVYEKDGARWLRIPDRTDEEAGAVLVKSDKAFSYLMGDIAYTRNKIIRGFDKLINIWGTDHHGDVPRLMAGIRALGYEKERMQIILHQLVSVKSGGEKQRMSKRKGEFVLLDELLAEVGKDAFRFFFLAKDLNTHMEFDIDLAKEQSNKNPVYYIQYAHARLNSIFEKIKTDSSALIISKDGLKLLKEPEEIKLMRRMAKFPELVEDISVSYQVHHLAQYAYELASDFHNFYEKHRVAVDDKELQQARAVLSSATKSVLRLCLSLMGLSAPEKM